ncbi:hypothetical protein, conserved [Trypanosoma cruzi]|uniref:Uncharacterized protein n=1 Tax=Trypanosoma cruzi (strain CL Brener) TaxID=353153 RepID=Q4E2J9_TRYCC|nr:hypothetical protein, conserved [Trypanosoma cruzi]EAN98998.1 hypothetical protein, conserved [Trypanosoma cruzi]|eukprot:XP_820849.1 hypothetical protein [Trypanosoma cruzi strain CL Brener]
MRMDPAAGVFSPFHELEGKNGLLENAVKLGTSEHSHDAQATASTPTVGLRETGRKKNKARDEDAFRRGTPCGGCGMNYTTSTVPTGGMYLCVECAAQLESRPKGYRFPPNTLKCCPASVAEGEDSVVRCCACRSWYHCACLDIHDRALKEYLTLSTTKWYCLEPSCCEKVLQEKLKKRR